MPSAGDVVIFDFPAARGVKRRPAVVISSDVYHSQRPDLILGILTSNVSAAKGMTDYELLDWKQAGLNKPSAFRAYFGMAMPVAVSHVGRLSNRDWQAVQSRVRIAFA